MVLGQKRLVVILPDGESGIASPSKFVGYSLGFFISLVKSFTKKGHYLHFFFATMDYTLTFSWIKITQ